jgi:hypothetical protein
VAGLRIFAMLELVVAMTMPLRAEACSCQIHEGTRAEQVLEALNDDDVVSLKHPPKGPERPPRDCLARHWPGSGRPVYPPQLTF